MCNYFMGMALTIGIGRKEVKNLEPLFYGIWVLDFCFPFSFLIPLLVLFSFSSLFVFLRYDLT